MPGPSSNNSASNPIPKAAGTCATGSRRSTTSPVVRPLSSLIYFLLAEGDASAWHKVDADEIWLWHGPAPVTIEMAGSGKAPDETAVRTVVLGTGIAASEDGDAAPVGHLVIPAGVWQRTVPGAGDALVSCVVSPGFEFAGFTLQ